MNYKRMVPNSISGLSLIFGILAIFKSLECNFTLAAIFIILAVCADACDGRMARLLNCQGEFGVQLDSLCDLCSFGVAPAILIYQYALTEWGIYGQLIAGLFTFSGAMRLARFNISTNVVHGYFQGMPIPAGACFLSTYVLSNFNFGVLFSAVMTIFIAFLLYSEVKFPDCKGKGNLFGPLSLISIIFGIIIGIYIIYVNLNAWAFALMSAYTFAGVFNYIFEMRVAK